MTIGNKIRTARKSKNLTQKELASLSGVSEISIRNYENNKRQPKLEQLARIAGVLEISIDYLLEKPNAPAPNVSAGDVNRLYSILVETGIVKQGEDLTDEQLRSISDFLRANSAFIRKISDEYHSDKS